jgi:hypothetical protein
MNDPDWLVQARKKGLDITERPHQVRLPGRGGGDSEPGLPASLPEKDFTLAVIALAQSLKWTVAHFRTAKITRKDGTVYYETPVQADGAGFPDLVMVRGSRIVWMELKSHRGKVSEEQKVWLGRLRGATEDVYVFRPADMKRIQEVLA